MKIKISTVLISSVVVTSGAFAQGANVSSETTDAFLAQFAERNEANQKDWRGYVWMRTHTGEKIEGWLTRWVQPLNKKSPCKIYQSTWVKKGDTPSWDDDRIYWDGDCRNG